MSDPSWVIKAGGKADAEVPEYLHDWNRAVPTNGDAIVWTEDQRHAWRFYDRNNAAIRCHSFPVCSYSDDVRVVKLTPSPRPCANPTYCKEPTEFRLVGPGIETKFCVTCNQQFQTRAVEPSSGSAEELRLWDAHGPYVTGLMRDACAATRLETIEACAQTVENCGTTVAVSYAHVVRALLKGGAT